jgi:peptidoglycan/xylan/chitin deacetylase (PgdA/CDA1 family)
MKRAIAAAVTGLSLLCAAAVGGLGAFFTGPTRFLPLATVSFIIVEAVLLYGVFGHRAPVFGRIFWRGRVDRPALALTFDDGPNEPYTSRILDILGRFEVEATFFVLGQAVEMYPHVIKRMAEEGHEVGNHGCGHDVLPLKSPSAIRREVRLTAELIKEATGTESRLFRVPHGWRNPWLGAAARKEGHVPVSWTFGVWDTSRPGADVIARRTLKKLGNGAIILLHDGWGGEEDADAGQTVTALPAILTEAKRRGYRFLTLSDMMKDSQSA